jgi:hypothetical protein
MSTIKNSRFYKSIIQQGNNLKSYFSNKGKNTNNNDIQKDIKRLENEISKLKNQEYHYSPIRLFILITIFSIAFFVLFLWLNHKYCFGISNDSIVLTFIGIIATFVVISNYIQVKEIERKFDSKRIELEQLFNTKVKDTECKISSFLHYKEAVSAKSDVDAFNSYILAVASWHDASFIDIKMIDSLLSIILIIVNRNSIDRIVSQYIKIDGFALDFCLDILYSKEVVNKNKHEIIFFIKELKIKGINKISYDGIEY